MGLVLKFPSLICFNLVQRQLIIAINLLISSGKGSDFLCAYLKLSDLKI